MALTLPLAITVGADSVSAPRTQGPDGRVAQYEWARADGSRMYTAKIAHTVPAVGKSGEQHMFRLDAQDIDAEGLPGLRSSMWIVFKSASAAQNTTVLTDMYTGVVGNLEANVNANLLAILAREL